MLPELVLADPVSLIAIGIQALLPAIGLTGAKIIGGILLVGALAGANFLMTPKPEAPPVDDPSDFKTTIKGEPTSEINAIGRVRLGGALIFGNTNGVRRYRLLGQCKGPIDGIENTYTGGQEVVVDATGDVVSNPWGEPEVAWINIKNKVGDGSETAWTDLLADFPAQWSGAHRVAGVGQVLTRYWAPAVGGESFATVFGGGEPPTEQVVRALKPYDPRTGTSQWTNNGILCALHVLLTWPEFSLDDFDLPFIGAEADKADALVPTLDGNAPRSRGSGVWLSERPRVEVMEQLLQSIGAELVWRPNDKLGIALIDDTRVSELSMPGKHVVDMMWRSGPESVERPNLCIVKYYSPENNYEMTEIELQKFTVGGAFIGPAWARVQSEIDAFGEKPMTIDLTFCPSAAQAQRIARRLFAVARADVGIATTNWTGLAAWGTRAITLELPDSLGSPIVALAPPRVDDDRGEVELSFTVWPSLPPWNVTNDEVPAPPALPDVASNISMARPAAPSNAVVVGGSTRIDVSKVGPGASTNLEAAYRTFDDVTGLPSNWHPMTVAPFDVIGGGTTSTASVPIDLTGITTEFRTRQFRNEYAEGDLDRLTAYATSRWSPSYLTEV